MNTPDLWTRISIKKTTDLAIVPVFCERSKLCLLEISIYFCRWLYDNLDFPAKVLETIGKDYCRWRRLMLHTDNREDFQTFTESIAKSPVPCLEFGFHLQRRTPFAGLTLLDIGFEPTHAEFRALFSESPSLETLQLRQYGSSSRHEPGSPSIEALSLRSLLLHFAPSHLDLASQCACPLSLVEMPNLEYLQIGSSLGSLTAHLPYRYPKVHTLRLDHVDFAPEHATFFRTLPMVTHLLCVDLAGELSVLLHPTSIDDGEAPPLVQWPHLQSLSIEPVIGYDLDFVSILESFVAARTNCPNLTIEIPPRYEADDNMVALKQCMRDGDKLQFAGAQYGPPITLSGLDPDYPYDTSTDSLSSYLEFDDYDDYLDHDAHHDSEDDYVHDDGYYSDYGGAGYHSDYGVRYYSEYLEEGHDEGLEGVAYYHSE